MLHATIDHTQMMSVTFMMGPPANRRLKHYHTGCELDKADKAPANSGQDVCEVDTHDRWAFM